MYKVGLSNKILKQLEKLNDSIYLKLSQKIFDLSNNPRPNGCLKLTDFDGYRIRVGNFRILYTINENTK